MFNICRAHCDTSRLRASTWCVLHRVQICMDCRNIHFETSVRIPYVYIPVGLSVVDCVLVFGVSA